MSIDPSLDAVTSGAPVQALLGPIVEAAPVALVVVAGDGRIAFVNREAERLFGYAHGELLGRRIELLVPLRVKASHAASRNAYFAQPLTRAMGDGRELQALRKDGIEVPVEIALKPLETSAGMFVLSVIVDISERKRLERRFELAIEAAPMAMLMVDSAGRIALVNRETEKLYGYHRAELIGQPVEILVPERFRVDDLHARERFYGATSARRLGTPGHEFHGLRKDGSEIPIEVALNPVPSEQGPMALITVVDITERRRLESAIRHASEELEQRVRERTAELACANREKEVLLADLQAQRLKLERLSREDPLTRLANRRDFDERLLDEIRRAERFGAPLAVAMFDLDRFKRINDRFGHALGDAVLRETANLMRRECRSIDIVARYGGEEFALALPGSDLPAGIALCERIRKAFERFDWSVLAPGLTVTISAGVGVWNAQLGAEALLAQADMNLYEAKRRGRNCTVPDACAPPAPSRLKSA